MFCRAEQAAVQAAWHTHTWGGGKDADWEDTVHADFDAQSACVNVCALLYFIYEGHKEDFLSSACIKFQLNF